MLTAILHCYTHGFDVCMSRSVRVGLLIAAVKLCYVLHRLIAVLVYAVFHHVVPFRLIAAHRLVAGTAGRVHLF